MHVQEIAVVEDLQAEVGELQVAVRVERGAEAFQVVVGEALVEELGFDALLHELAAGTARSARPCRPA